MNFVIFPTLFLSPAFYPLWQLANAAGKRSTGLVVNPFTHAVVLFRFAAYGQFTRFRLRRASAPASSAPSSRPSLTTRSAASSAAAPQTA